MTGGQFQLESCGRPLTLELLGRLQKPFDVSPNRQRVIGLLVTCLGPVLFARFVIDFAISYDRLANVWLVYFSVANAVVLILAQAWWDAMVRIDRRTAELIGSSKEIERVSEYVSDVLSRRRQGHWMSAGAVAGLLATAAAQVATGDQLTFGVASYVATGLSAGVAANGMFAGLYVPLVLRAVLGSSDLRLTQVTPVDTPGLDSWSRVLLHYTGWSAGIFVVYSIPPAYALSLVDGSTQIVLAAIVGLGLSFAVASAVWLGVLPHWWVRRTIIEAKYEINEDLNARIGLAAEGSSTESGETLALMLDQVRDSANSPIAWHARTLAIVALGFGSTAATVLTQQLN